MKQLCQLFQSVSNFRSLHCDTSPELSLLVGLNFFGFVCFALADSPLHLVVHIHAPSKDVRLGREYLLVHHCREFCSQCCSHCSSPLHGIIAQDFHPPLSLLVCSLRCYAWESNLDAFLWQVPSQTRSEHSRTHTPASQGNSA